MAFTYPIELRWRDLDAFNHVNNVVYYNYAQRARIHYLEQVDMFNLQTHTVIASSSCQYLNSVTFPDVLWIGIRAKKIGNTSLTHDYVYFSTAQQKVVATASSVIVFFDQTGKNKQPKWLANSALKSNSSAEFAPLKSVPAHTTMSECS